MLCLVQVPDILAPVKRKPRPKQQAAAAAGAELGEQDQHLQLQQQQQQQLPRRVQLKQGQRARERRAREAQRGTRFIVVCSRSLHALCLVSFDCLINVLFFACLSVRVL